MIRWDAKFPGDVRAIAEPHLMRWIGLLPTWCQELRVRYRPGDNCSLSVDVNHRNRWAVLNVTGQWLGNPDDEREVHMIHELVHVALEPMSSAAVRIIEDLTEQGTPLRSLADSMYTDGLEASVEDLARAIRRVAGLAETRPTFSKKTAA